MDELTKVKVLLMQEVKDSSLPKGGKLLLLDLVVENEDLDQTAEVLEAFGVINEDTKKKIGAWLNKHRRGVKTGVVAGGLLAALGGNLVDIWAPPEIEIQAEKKKKVNKQK
jgi:hypothetical protein